MTPFRERNKTVIGAIGITVILGMLYGAFNIDKIAGGDELTAEFTEAAGLKPNDEVRVAGVKVGKVTDVELAGDRVLVTFQVRGAELGDKTRADIRIKTVLGRKFLMLTPDGTGELDEDQVIPLDRTSSPYDVTDAFRGLATTVEEIDTAQLEQAYRTLADTFRDTPDEVQASLRGLSRLSRTIASRDAQLKELLDRSRGVTEVLAARDEDLTQFLADSSLVLQELRARRQAISDLLDGTTELSEQLVALVRANRAQLAPTLRRLQSVTEVLRANQDNLDKTIPRLAAFTRLQGNTVGSGRWFDSVVHNLSEAPTFKPRPQPTSGAPR